VPEDASQWPQDSGLEATDAEGGDASVEDADVDAESDAGDAD
jgi:hypothetical protein